MSSQSQVLPPKDALTDNNDTTQHARPPPFSMPDALLQSSPSNALLQLSNYSQSNALRLAQELVNSLNNNNNNNSQKTTPKSKPSLLYQQQKQQQRQKTKQQELENFYPIPVPTLLTKSSSSTNTTKHSHSHNQNPLTTSKACTESILHSLTKVASGGSAASTTLRNLESQRRSTDMACKDLHAALIIRQQSNIAADALGARRYNDAVKAIHELESVLIDIDDGSSSSSSSSSNNSANGTTNNSTTTNSTTTSRANRIAGPHAVRAYERTKDVLQRSILERFEIAVNNNDLRELSNLTPLLGLLKMADKGVGLYLKFAQDNLSLVINQNLDVDTQTEEKQLFEEQEKEAGVRISRAEAKRREDENKLHKVTVCTKLAKIYNAAVTFLRHHLPMVAYSLGEADGDAALVQLVHTEVENRAVDVIRQYIVMRKMSKVHMKSNAVANMIEEKYLNDGDGLEYDEQILMDARADADAAAAAVISSSSNTASSHVANNFNVFRSTSAADKKAILDKLDDCGFNVELGTFLNVNANLDEMALLLQHTESYERFIRHAVDEVNKARNLRKEQKREQKKKKFMSDLENQGKDVTVEEVKAFEKEMRDIESKQRIQNVLPNQTQLNDVVAEVGGYFSVLERTFLLANIQRAFQSGSYPDERTFSPITISQPNNNSHHQYRSSNNFTGCKALQTSVVEECLYAAQRSTLRAFATGHNGTASAASNFCSDTLGRFLLEVLVHRTETAASMLKPGDGLLPGHGGLGQAALAVMSSAQKGLSKATTKGLYAAAGETESERNFMRYNIEQGIARSCANFNDLEVAVDYTKQLETKMIQEMQSTFPHGTKETEQLTACIKALSAVKDSFKIASNEAIEHLIATFMPRVRSIVNESVGQDSTTVGTGFNVMGGGATPAHQVRMNYHLDNNAYEMAQISEGFMSRLCTSLDEIISPMRIHLTPRLSDSLILGIIGGASKRLEAAIKRSQLTPLGALALDSDIRFFVNFVRDRLDSSELASSVTLYRACNPLARLVQISLLMNVDDLEDVLDLISSSKRKQMWDISLSDAKAFLNLRVDFEGRKVNELLQISDD